MAWVDERFNFQPPISDPKLRNIDIAGFDGVVIDPFDPKLTWEQGRQNELTRLSDVMDAVQDFALGHPKATQIPLPVAPMWSGGATLFRHSEGPPEPLAPS